MDADIWDSFFSLGQQALSKGDLEQALEGFTAAVSECHRSQLPLNRLALSMNNLAAVVHRLGRTKEAIELCENALALYPMSSSEESSVTAERGLALANLAELYWSEGRFNDSEVALLSAAEKLQLAQEWQAFFQVEEQRAQLYLQLEKYPQACQLLESLASYPEYRIYVGLEDQVRQAHILGNLFDALGQYTKADQLRSKAVLSLREIWADKEMELAAVVENMVESCLAHQRPAAALELLGQIPPLKDLNARAVLALRQAQLLRECATLDQAEELLCAVLKDSQLRGGPFEAQFLNELGLVYFLRQDYERSGATFSAALDSHQSPATTDHFRLSLLYNLACSLQGQAQAKDAEACYRRALELVSAQPSLAGSSLLARVVWNLATLLESRGEVVESERLKTEYVAALG